MSPAECEARRALLRYLHAASDHTIPPADRLAHLSDYARHWQLIPWWRRWWLAGTFRVIYGTVPLWLDEAEYESFRAMRSSGLANVASRLRARAHRLTRRG